MGGGREKQRQGSHSEGVFITSPWVHGLELRHRRHLTARKQSTCQDVGVLGSFSYPCQSYSSAPCPLELTNGRKQLYPLIGCFCSFSNSCIISAVDYITMDDPGRGSSHHLLCFVGVPCMQVYLQKKRKFSGQMLLIEEGWTVFS